MTWSSRIAAVSPWTGPSWTPRRPTTTRSVPSVRCTVRPSSSLARMGAPRDPFDDVPAGPSFERGRAELVLWDGHGDGAADVLDEGHVDAFWCRVAVGRQAARDGPDPEPEPAAEPRSQSKRAGQDAGDVVRTGSVDRLGQLEVVHLADHAAVGIDHLPVEQVQLQVEHPPSWLGRAVRRIASGLGGHWPAFV